MLEKQSSGSQSGNHSVLFFSFLSPFEWPAREREMDGWMDGQMIESRMDWQEVKLTMAGGCSNLTLFVIKFCNLIIITKGVSVCQVISLNFE
jgi:hypothetical protein